MWFNPRLNMARGRSGYRLNREALSEILTNPGVVAEVEAVTKRIHDEANDTLREGWGYNYAVHKVTKRRKRGYVIGRVYTFTQHAKNSNAKYDTLVRLVG